LKLLRALIVAACLVLPSQVAAAVSRGGSARANSERGAD
jgi:hypothetical protein